MLVSQIQLLYHKKGNHIAGDAMIAPSTTKKTFADYAALPESNLTTELIDGEIIVTSVLNAHAELLTRLFGLLFNLLKEGVLRTSTTGLYIDNFNTFEPDIFWISPENQDCVLRPDDRNWEGAPDLVIEILSPSTAFRDRGIKFRTYQTVGVREYWIADPVLRFIEVYKLQDGYFVQVGVFQSGEHLMSSVVESAIDLTPIFAY